MIMTTTKRILSSLALTAATLVIVPLSADEAAAKGGFGARSFGAARTTPMVVTKYRAVSSPAVRRLTYTTAKSHTASASTHSTSTAKTPQTIGLGGLNPCVSCLPGARQDPRDHRTPGQAANGDPRDHRTIPLPLKPPSTGSSPGQAHNQGGNQPGGAGTVGTGMGGTGMGGTGTGTGIGKGGTGSTGTGMGGGTTTGGTISREPPPVVTVERPHPVYPPAVGIGVAPAPGIVEPPGCVYERSVHKLPGGGLQRVIVKVCPDV
jgi:hypothetical protein